MPWDWGTYCGACSYRGLALTPGHSLWGNVFYLWQGNCPQDISIMWLPIQPSDDTSWHPNMHKRNLTRSHPQTKNCRQLRNSAIRINSLPQGRVHWCAVQYPSRPPNHTNNITQTEWVICRNTHVCALHAFSSNQRKRRGHEFKRVRRGIWEDLEGGKEREI